MGGKGSFKTRWGLTTFRNSLKWGGGNKRGKGVTLPPKRAWNKAYLREIIAYWTQIWT